MKNDSNVILLTADLGFGAFDCFEEFRNKQYFNVGVSEQLMASMAAGLSLEGFKVYIYTQKSSQFDTLVENKYFMSF